MGINNQTVFKNLIWRFAERIGAQGVSLVVSIVLARILAPEAYGKVALLTVFSTILEVFVDSGLGNALIQKKDADTDDFTTVFCFNIVWSLILYGIFYLAAPLIAEFYGDSGLTSLTRAAGLTIIIAGVKNIQLAYVSRTMQFKKFFIATLGGTLFSGVIGIALAYSGYGAWALVIQILSNASIDTLILWLTVKWRPTGKFRLQRLKNLLSYGWKLLASALLDTIYRNLRSLIIGKKYTSEDLAYYNKAASWPELIVTNVNTSIDSVLLPTLSSEQDNRKRVMQMTRRAISMSTYVMAPMMLGLFGVAPTLVSFLLTDKWLPIVPYMRIFCITYMFYPIHTANLNAIKAMGRSDIFLKLEIIKKIIGLIILFSTMWFGPLVMAYSMLLNTLLCQIVNAWPNRKMLGYSYFEQMKDIMPNILLATVMCVMVCSLSVLRQFLPDVLALLVQVAAGGLFYVAASVLLKNENFLYLWKVLKSMIHRKDEKNAGEN